MKTLGHLARFATIGALVLGGIAVGTSSASAATSNWGCRGDQLDRNGNPLEIKAHGFEAIVFQHELDHLDGKLFLDRVASLETDVFRRKKYT